MPETIVIGEALENAFKRRNVGYSLPGSTKRETFTTLEKFITFINKEIEFWSPLGSSHEITRKYQTIQQNLAQALGNQHQPNAAETSLSNALQLFSPNQWPCILSALPESRRCIELFKQNSQQGQAYLDYFRNRTFTLNGNGNADYVTGVIDVVISTQGKAILRRATTSEEAALRAVWDNYVEDKTRLDTELEQLRLEHRQRIEEITVQYKSFDDEMSAKREEINTWHQNTENQYKDFLVDGQEKLAHIEKTYREHMRLEGPAEYWKEMQQFYEKRGRGWIIATSILTALCVICLTVFLYNLPSWLFSSSSTSVIENIKGTVILGLIVSAAAYLIRLFVRLSMSAYHLSRDAKERRQLTSVYLALMDKKVIEEADRAIVLQALFSRADTGLLKGDASPTMPDGASLVSAVRNLTR